MRFGRRWTSGSPSRSDVSVDTFTKEEKGERDGAIRGWASQGTKRRLVSPREGPARVGGGDLDLGQLQLAADYIGPEVDGHALVEGDASGQALAPEPAVRGEHEALGRHV